MRKSFLLAATVMAVFGLGFAGYLYLVDRSNNVEQAEAITAETLSDELPDKSPDTSADETLQEFLDGPYWHSAKSGAITEFFLDGGDIGYVDVGSILTDRNSYSIVALLQEHSEHTGADELLELEIVSAGGIDPQYDALFVQVIKGVPMERPGRIIFDSDGTVSAINGDLVSTMEAEIGDIVIQQAEAENIAVDAARRYSTIFRRNNGLDSSEEPLRIEASSGEFHYATVPSADNSLRAEWRVAVTIYGAPWSVEVTVGASTGNVFGVKRLIQPAASSTGCSELTFRVCDATAMSKHSSRTCGEGILQGGKPVLDGNSCVAQKDQGRCSQSRYTGIRDNANGIRDYIKRIGKKAGEDYLSGIGGADCKIDILINADTDLMETVNGESVDGQ